VSQALAPRPPAQPPALARPLQGRQKAAVVLVSLGPERAAEILQHLPQEEVEALSAEMAGLWRVTPEVAAPVFEELALRLQVDELEAQGGLEYAREVLERLLGPDKADEIISALALRGQVRPFDFLRKTPPDQIRTFLQDEAPQTVALVLASLHATISGRVLSEMEPEEQADVALRIATMRETNPGVINDIDSGLRLKLSSISTQEFASPGGVDSLAEILNGAGRSSERHVIEALGEQDPDLANQVRLRMFTFDDLIELEDRDIQLILREIDAKDLVIALRGVSEELTDKILRNMSQRGAEMLREDMEVQPPQRRAVVEEAQGKVVAVVRRLEEAGAVILRRGGEEGGEDELL
jgi:flagellar motor switch protein FliG